MKKSKKNIDAAMSVMGVLVDLITGLTDAVEEIGGSMEAIYRLVTPEGAETLEKLAKTIVDDFRKTQDVCLKLLSGTENLTIEALNGKAITSEAKKTFQSGDFFRNWGLDDSEIATAETKLAVYEITADVTFSQMFSSLADNLDRIVMTQNQIIQFCKEHATWLRPGSYANFFLIKKGGKYFVVDVYYDSGLNIQAYNFDINYVWCAVDRHRLVVPVT